MPKGSLLQSPTARQRSADHSELAVSYKTIALRKSFKITMNRSDAKRSAHNTQGPVYEVAIRVWEYGIKFKVARRIDQRKGKWQDFWYLFDLYNESDPVLQQLLRSGSYNKDTMLSCQRRTAPGDLREAYSFQFL